MNEPILVELSERILTLRFNRPDKKNALNPAMYRALADALTAARSNDEVRVVLLAGQPDCFTSGNDVTMPPDGRDTAVDDLIDALVHCAKPVVAAPCGLAIGAGLTMLMYCDLVYCGEQTTLRAPFVSLGVCPELGSTYMLPRIMGHQRASALLLTGEAIGAAQARDAGLVNEILPNAEVEAHARAKARLIAAQAPQAVRTTKLLLRRWDINTVEDACRIEMAQLRAMLREPEFLEAQAALAQRRPADFSRFR
jgi:enoyl-CoA hydratase/carnithine racemase